MPRWGMVIDLARCSGCGSCAVACKAENNVPLGTPDDVETSRTFAWMQVMRIDHVHGSKDETPRYLPRPCMQCDDAPCTKVCPVEATWPEADGIVVIDYNWCIGCRYCTQNCPYTAKYFNWHTPEFPEEMQAGLNPDVTVRPKGVVEKCTFCHHRMQRVSEQARAEDRRIRDGEYVPACLEVCPTRAIHFGDLTEETSEVYRLSRSRRAFRELEDLGTGPKVYYLREDI